MKDARSVRPESSCYGNIGTTQAREGIDKVHGLRSVSLGKGRGRGYLECRAMLDGYDFDGKGCGDVLSLARDWGRGGGRRGLCRLDHERGEEEGARDERNERKPR